MEKRKLISSVTSKGQATIPARIRETLNVAAGDQVIFEIVNGKVFLRKAEPFDYDYHRSLSTTLSEWNSKEDDEAFNGL